MEFSPEVLAAFPGIGVAEGDIRSVRIEPQRADLEAGKIQVLEGVRGRYTLENVRNEPVFRAYRDFFWSVGVDPTKTRPASEALVRRILTGGTLPVINTAVDAYNLASALSGVPIAAFDLDTLSGGLLLRFARNGEEFLGIGMKKPLVLRENQVVMTDNARIIAVYPYRDSDSTKVTPATTNIRIVSCGVPGIAPAMVAGAFATCVRYLEEYTGGVSTGYVLYPRDGTVHT
ncbi:DNA/RNA-binding domain of Phe-tRNA-synthetase-like protein [Methanolinea mesophila]|uniref:B3/B4 domain-containing protein n=1 Tax=Methanolinea mesophila TaxID=547055 RepID=UPI001AE467CE|nr:phenylalanine--tRNA ligase beta subunit-related protein [Methanolinea mesophila]MBP1929499.1 DNA/RNA-binding domain of Phe-tRNA-synthetase-like protein [Methanolinea mesophila]